MAKKKKKGMSVSFILMDLFMQNDLWPSIYHKLHIMVSHLARYTVQGEIQCASGDSVKAK